MAKRHNQFAGFIFLGMAAFSCSPYAYAANVNSHVGLLDRLAECFGSSQAASPYDTYVDGLPEFRRTAGNALKKLLPALGGNSSLPYIEAAAAAREQFAKQLLLHPMHYRESVLNLMSNCEMYIDQAKVFGSALDRRDAEAMAAREAERQAKLKAENDKRQHQFELEKIQAEAQREKAEAERQAKLKAENDKRQHQFELEKIQAEAQREKAEAEREKAEAEREKAEAERILAMETAEKKRQDHARELAVLEKQKAEALRAAAEAEARTQQAKTELAKLEAQNNAIISRDHAENEVPASGANEESSANLRVIGSTSDLFSCFVYYTIVSENGAPRERLEGAQAAKALLYFAIEDGVPESELVVSEDKMKATIKKFGGRDGRLSTAMSNMKQHCTAYTQKIDDALDKRLGASMGL